MIMISNLHKMAHNLWDISPYPVRLHSDEKMGGKKEKKKSKKVVPAGFKSEGDFRSPIALPNAPAFGSGDGGIGSLFALNPEVKD